MEYGLHVADLRLSDLGSGKGGVRWGQISNSLQVNLHRVTTEPIMLLYVTVQAEGDYYPSSLKLWQGIYQCW
jgi:hypothetical protein